MINWTKSCAHLVVGEKPQGAVASVIVDLASGVQNGKHLLKCCHRMQFLAAGLNVDLAALPTVEQHHNVIHFQSLFRSCVRVCV